VPGSGLRCRRGNRHDVILYRLHRLLPAQHHMGAAFLVWALPDDHAARPAVPRCLILRTRPRSPARCPVPGRATAPVTVAMWRCTG